MYSNGTANFGNKAFWEPTQQEAGRGMKASTNGGANAPLFFLLLITKPSRLIPEVFAGFCQGQSLPPRHIHFETARLPVAVPTAIKISWMLSINNASNASWRVPALMFHHKVSRVSQVGNEWSMAVPSSGLAVVAVILSVHVVPVKDTEIISFDENIYENIACFDCFIVTM